MKYVFQFGVVADHADVLIAGAKATLWFTFLGAVFGLALAIICAYLRAAGPKPGFTLMVAAPQPYTRNEAARAAVSPEGTSLKLTTGGVPGLTTSARTFTLKLVS